jgi:pyruvate dehydrogenase E2 component (dihydrolipoyllysine-residue acetyltransferase)
MADSANIAPVAAAKGDVTVRDPTPAERAVARRTAEARATIPDLELTLEADVGELAADGVTLDGRLLAACAAALRTVPRANGAYRDGRLESYARVNIGFVVADGDTYLIPTVFDADAKSPAELSREVEELTAAARARTLTQPAFAGATFTLWNAGALGLSRAGMVINPPQAGALAAGALREVPAVRDGVLVTRRMLTLTLACDHRILYGAAAAAFLHAVATGLAPGP